MATAADTFTWLVHEAPLKAWLEITGTDEDVWLEKWLAGAALDCDRYCGWYYTDDDDEIVDETPTDPSADALITMGVYEWVRTMREVVTSDGMKGIQGARTGAISVQYAGGVKGITAIGLARKTAEGYWADSVLNPLIMGKGY